MQGWSYQPWGRLLTLKQIRILAQLSLVFICCGEDFSPEVFFLQVVDHGVVVDGIVSRVVNELVRFLADQVLLIEAIALQTPVGREITEGALFYLYFVEQRLEDLLAVLEADFSVSQEILSDPVLGILVDESNPVMLVTVLHPLEFAPMVAHHFLVVVRYEGFEDFRLLCRACVDLRKQRIDKELLDHNYWLLAPDLRSRHIQGMPQANLNLVHQQLL